MGKFKMSKKDGEILSHKMVAAKNKYIPTGDYSVVIVLLVFLVNLNIKAAIAKNSARKIDKFIRNRIESDV